MTENTQETNSKSGDFDPDILKTSTKNNKSPSPDLPSKTGIIGHILAAEILLIAIIFAISPKELYSDNAIKFSVQFVIAPAVAILSSWKHYFKPNITSAILALKIGTAVFLGLWVTQVAIDANAIITGKQSLHDALTTNYDLVAVSFFISEAIYLIPLLTVRHLLSNRFPRFVLHYFSLSYAENIEIKRLISSYAKKSEIISRVLPDAPMERLVAISDLRQRAKNLRRTNILILGMVLAILCGAALFIVYAGQITSRDSQALTTLSSIAMSVKEQQQYIDTLQAERASLAENSETVGDMDEPNTINEDSEYRKWQKELNILRREGLKNAILANKSTLISAREELQRRIDVYKKYQEGLIPQSARSESEYAVTELLVAGGITRFGVLIISVYFVQILIGLYKYNVQAAAHYFAQADSLLLLGHGASDIGDLASVLRLSADFELKDAAPSERTLSKFGDVVEKVVERVHSKN